jgi:hypothetical protein
MLVFQESQLDNITNAAIELLMETVTTHRSDTLGSHIIRGSGRVLGRMS